MAALAPCPDCKALVPDIDGPTHAYIGGSPGCWAIFGELQAQGYDGQERPPIFRLVGDTYAVQHHGVPSRRAIQSVAVHLIALCCYLERGFHPHDTTENVRKALKVASEFIWLEPPGDPGPVTILDVYNAPDIPRQTTQLEAWIKSVWAAWSPHHATVRHWADHAGCVMSDT